MKLHRGRAAVAKQGFIFAVAATVGVIFTVLVLGAVFGLFGAQLPGLGGVQVVPPTGVTPAQVGQAIGTVTFTIADVQTVDVTTNPTLTSEAYVLYNSFGRTLASICLLYTSPSPRD